MTSLIKPHYMLPNYNFKILCIKYHISKQEKMLLTSSSEVEYPKSKIANERRYYQRTIRTKSAKSTLILQIHKKFDIHSLKTNINSTGNQSCKHLLFVLQTSLGNQG
ncbi:unnamed protein product [Paramecium octaurelia]|uniref:Uncharacterized protein n=1 Tax=Paramecium octaurelia TaxID=43137 RepID=A0A8S1WQV7_PAROT|nr:unnamed protein product [Paramecium octaurelia]